MIVYKVRNKEKSILELRVEVCMLDDKGTLA